MTSATDLPFGTALALAQRVLTAPLTAVLAAERLSAPEWFTLNALGLRGTTRQEELAGLLATNGLDAAAVDALITGMERSGLLVASPHGVTLSPSGSVRYAAVRDRMGGVTTRIFARFEPQRVETARALLTEIATLDPDELTRRSVAS